MSANRTNARHPFLCMADAIDNGESRVVVAVHAMHVDDTLALTLHSVCFALCSAPRRSSVIVRAQPDSGNAC